MGMPELGFPRRIIYGEDAGESLLQLLEMFEARRVLVITDRSIMETGAFRRIMSVLASNYDVEVYPDVRPEPGIEIAVDASRHAEGVDVIIAIGGGSVIDVAKAASVLAKRPDVGIEDIAPFNLLRVEYGKPYLVAVPTTAGTGSDASYGIVLSKVEPGIGRLKIAVGSFEVIPHATILDPKIPQGAPTAVRVGALADAVSHALEALASTSANPLSDALAEKSLVLLFTRAERAVRDGEMEAWRDVHLAATMAGAAFSNSGLGLAHAIAHPLGGLIGRHHGMVVGIVMLGVLQRYMEVPHIAEKYSRVQLVLEKAYRLEERRDLAEHLVALYAKIGHPMRFRELGVDYEEFKVAAGKAAELSYHDPDIAFSPVIPDTEEIEELIMSLY